MSFSHIWASILGIICLLLFWLSYFGKKRGAFVIAGKMREKNLQRIFSYIYLLSQSVALILLTWAAMGPKRAVDLGEETIAVNDLFFVMDVSRSMEAVDFQPNRLEVAKKRLLDFLNLRPNDRLGVIIFSDRPFTLMPLTTDLELIKRAVSGITTGILGGGTNIGDSVALAVARVKESPTKNKVIVLLTDGVSQLGSITPIQSAELAKAAGIKIYTIGIGSEEGAKLPIGKGVFGMQYTTIPGGSIDFATLEKMSALSGGKSFVANDENALIDIFNAINQLERTEIKKISGVREEELFWPYAFSGTLLLILNFSIAFLWARRPW